MANRYLIPAQATLNDVARAYSKVINKLHRDDLEPDKASKLGYLLGQLRATITAIDDMMSTTAKQAVEADYTIEGDEDKQRQALAQWLRIQLEEGKTLAGVIGHLEAMGVKQIEEAKA